MSTMIAHCVVCATRIRLADAMRTERDWNAALCPEHETASYARALATRDSASMHPMLLPSTEISNARVVMNHGQMNAHREMVRCKNCGRSYGRYKRGLGNSETLKSRKGSFPIAPCPKCGAI